MTFEELLRQMLENEPDELDCVIGRLKEQVKDTIEMIEILESLK